MCLLFPVHVRRIPLDWNPIRTSALILISSDKAHRDTSENESSLMHFSTDSEEKEEGEDTTEEENVERSSVCLKGKL